MGPSTLWGGGGRREHLLSALPSAPSTRAHMSCEVQIPRYQYMRGWTHYQYMGPSSIWGGGGRSHLPSAHCPSTIAPVSPVRPFPLYTTISLEEGSHALREDGSIWEGGEMEGAASSLPVAHPLVPCPYTMEAISSRPLHTTTYHY